MQEAIDLKELFLIIKRKFKMIILIGLIFGVVSAIISTFFITPEYRATTTIIINKENSRSETQLYTSDDLNYVQKLALTYSKIITSRAVINKTAQQLNLDISYKKMAQAIDVTNITNTQIIQIAVEYENPEIARDICNTIPKVFDTEVQRIMKVSGVEVIDSAITPKVPSKPNKVKNVLLSVVFGILVGIAVAIIQCILDTKVKTPSDVKEKLGMPVLGIIPKQ